MKRKNILKKSSRSVLSISMCIIILFGTFITGGSANASTSNYSHSAAVDYAKKHWNDGVGLCAQFVAACITAGGISVSDKVCYNLYNSLKPYGTVYKLKTYGSGKNTRIRMADNSGKVSAGDPLFYVCETCGGMSKSCFPHVVLCGGVTSDGFLTAYAHNAAWNNRLMYTVFSSGAHSGHSTSIYSIHLDEFSYATAPTNCSISANSTSVGVGDTVTLSYNINYATSRNIGIDYAGGNRYDNVSVSSDSGSVSYTFTQAGTYCCIIEGSNNVGYSCSHGVYVTVIDTAPINCELSVSKTIVAVGEPITFDYTILGATIKKVGIDYAGGNRYETIPVADDSGSLSYTFTEAGTYCCIIEGYNSIGLSYSSGVYVTVIDTAPTNCSISANSTSVGVGDTVTLSYNINYATSRNIGIDYAGGNRYDNVSVSSDSGSVSYTFTQAGTYCCIIEGSNNVGYSCSHGVYVTVIDTAPINCELSVSKTIVAVGEPITFDYTILGATIKKVGIDYAGGNRYETIPVADDSGSLSYTFTEAGTYCCIIEGYNSIGLSYSSGVYVTVIDTGTEFTISFDANGGFCSTSKKSVTYGAAYGELPIPEKEGYSFSGWFTSADGGTEITSSSMVNITANQTLYAHWSTCDHNYTVIESVDPSCTKEGSKTLKCTKCGNTYNEKIEKKAHTAVIDNSVAATCTTAGLTEGSHCSTCGTVIKARTTVPATGHTDMNNDGLCDKCGKSLAPTVYPKLSIRIPSVTTVSYGFTLNLHANVTDLPEGARVAWNMDGSGFELMPSADGMTCGVKSVSKGSATITAKVVDKSGNAVKDANGNEITASQKLTSKAGFFQKLAAFFKRLFGSNMVIPSSLNKLVK